jgi:type II secretory pathway component HofQ
MVTLEQVKLLETKVAKAIDFVNRVTDENTLLRGKLETYRKRIDELEGLVQRFKEDQGRIEEGILSALDRLNQFEDAIGRSLSSVVQAAVEKSAPASPAESNFAPPSEEEPSSVSLGASFPEAEESGEAAAAAPEAEEPSEAAMAAPETEESDEAIMAALEAEAAAKAGQDASSSGENNNSEELDIF